MSDESILFESAVSLAEQVRAGTLSPVELTEISLARIAALNPALNSVVTLDPEGALDAARAAEKLVADTPADQREQLPPFLGVPTLIKDVHAAAGMRATFGTQALAEFEPPWDSEHVARMRTAGFIFLGKSNVPEFGTVPVTESQLHGPARNPWNPAHTPGGSSGGAAAAVSAGMVPIADGSDGGGSIRIPASCCGVFGLKPSRGRISNAPLFGDIYLGIVTPGPISRYTADAAALLDVESGYAPGDPHWAPPPARPFAQEAAAEPGRLRIGLVTESPVPDRPFDAQVVRETAAVGALLESLGHDVVPFSLPVTDLKLIVDFTVLWSTGLASNPVPRELLEPFNQTLAEQGAKTTGVELLQAFSSIQLQCRAIVTACLQVDVVVMPTLTRPAPLVGEWADLDPWMAYAAGGDFVGFTPIANLTGQPAASMPLGWSDDGLPIGITALGRPADEATLLRLAAQLEAATQWPTRRPPLSATA